MAQPTHNSETKPGDQSKLIPFSLASIFVSKLHIAVWFQTGQTQSQNRSARYCCCFDSFIYDRSPRWQGRRKSLIIYSEFITELARINQTVAEYNYLYPG